MTSAAGRLFFRREIAACHLAGILAGAGATMLGPLLPVLARTWSLGDAQAGALLGAEFFGGFCGAIASSWLGGRFSLMKLLTAGLFLLASGFAGAAFMLQSWMAPSLFVCGLGLGFINPMANLFVSMANQPSPAAALNLFSFSWAAGALSAPAAIAVCLRYQSSASVFLELASLTAAAGAFAAFDTLTAAVTKEAASPHKRQTASGLAPFIVTTAALLFLYVGVETGVSVWLPTGAARWAAATAPRAAATQSAFWAALLIGRLLAPVWLRRLSPAALVLAGLCCAAAGIGMLLAASAYGIMLPGAVLAGLGLAPINPTVVAAFTTRLGSAAVRWTGPVFAASGLGGAALPWMVGALSSHFASLRLGFAALLAAMAGMLVLYAVEQTIALRRLFFR